jgi:D-glycero-D-manno-heptose 1,7-bisphosphate phosphatase
MNRQLAAAGATLDGIYACPAHDDHPERKPAPGMLLRAAEELRLDLARSWMIGDSARDVQAGWNAGCRGCILVRSGNAVDDAHLALLGYFHVADDLRAAANLVLSGRFVS